jgi:hypothetical protein
MNWQTTGYITYQQSGRSALCTAIPKSLTRADGISGLLSQAEAISKYPQFSTTHWTQSPNVHLAAQRAVRSVMRSDDEDKTLDATIGIVAPPFGNNDRERLTHPMPQRAAATLAPAYSSETNYQVVK